MTMTKPDIRNLGNWYTLKENGGTAYDSHGYGQLTQHSGTITRGNGKIGYCRNFEKDSTHYLKGTLVGGFSYRKSQTIGLWIKLESIGSTMNIIYTPGRFYLRVNSSGKLEVGVNDDSSWTTRTHTDTLLPATWYFVTVVLDWATNIFALDVKLRVNNGTELQTGLLLDSGIHYEAGESYIGASNTNTDHFDGKMDEMFVFSGWDTVMSADEISWLYNEGNGRAYSDMQTQTSGIIAMF